jgi:hypothetical protein
VPMAPNWVAPMLGDDGRATPLMSSGTTAFTFLPAADNAATVVDKLVADWN